MLDAWVESLMPWSTSPSLCEKLEVGEEDLFSFLFFPSLIRERWWWMEEKERCSIIGRSLDLVLGKDLFGLQQANPC